MDVLVQQLSGESVPALITLPSKLIVRQSCGCPSAAIALASYSPPNGEAPPKEGTSLKETRADCLSEIVMAIGLTPEAATDWPDQVFDAFTHDLENISATKQSSQLLSV